MIILRNNQEPNEIISNFETTLLHLSPYDPVTKRKYKEHKREHASISKSNSEVSSSLLTPKPSIRKTRFHFRQYDQDEFHKLSNAQQIEILENNKSLKKREIRKRSNLQRMAKSLVNVMHPN